MAAFADVIAKEGYFGGGGLYLKIPEIYAYAIVNVRFQVGNEIIKTENFILKGGEIFGREGFPQYSNYTFVTAICYLPTSNNATVTVAPPVILEVNTLNISISGVQQPHYQFKIAPFVPVPPTETLSSIIYEFYQHNNNNRILYTGVITNNFTSYQTIPLNLIGSNVFTLRVKFRTVSGFESGWTVGGAYG